jgi:hypothetical protein
MIFFLTLVQIKIAGTICCDIVRNPLKKCILVLDASSYGAVKAHDINDDCKTRCCRHYPVIGSNQGQKWI